MVGEQHLRTWFSKCLSQSIAASSLYGIQPWGLGFLPPYLTWMCSAWAWMVGIEGRNPHSKGTHSFKRRGSWHPLLALEVTSLAAASATSSTKGLGRGSEVVLETLPHPLFFTYEGLLCSPLPLQLFVLWNILYALLFLAAGEEEWIFSSNLAWFWLVCQGVSWGDRFHT